jgi:hypothetical protein
VEVSLRDIGRIALPSLPAFALHKLLIASLSQREEKRAKDYIQVCAVAKKIITDKKLIDEVQNIFFNMPESWRKKIRDSARILPKFVEDCNVDFSALLSYPK